MIMSAYRWMHGQPETECLWHHSNNGGYALRTISQRQQKISLDSLKLFATTENMTSLSNKHAHTVQQKQPKANYWYLNLFIIMSHQIIT